MKKSFLLIWVIFTIFTGCNNNNYPTVNNNYNSSSKQVYVGNFSQVCNGGKVDGTAGYDKSAETISPISIYFQPNSDQNFRDEYLLDFPKDWKTNYSNPEKTQLVACLTISEIKEKRRCPYQEEGKTYQLIMNDVKYNAKVYEAKTGAVVVEKDFDLKADKGCPMVTMFSSSEETQNPDYKQSLINFLKPLVKH